MTEEDLDSLGAKFTDPVGFSEMAAERSVVSKELRAGAVQVAGAQVLEEVAIGDVSGDLPLARHTGRDGYSATRATSGRPGESIWHICYYRYDASWGSARDGGNNGVAI